jgi:integral membrane protein
MLSTNLGRLRVLGVLEGISWILLLFVGMPLKYSMDMPMPNKVIGMVHGILFILYVLFVYITSQETNWKGKTSAWLYIAAFFPFGTFISDAKILKRIK